MTKLTESRQEQLKIAQRKLRQKHKRDGKAAVLVYLDQTSYKLLRRKKAELSTDYAGVIKTLLEQKPQTHRASETDCKCDVTLGVEDIYGIAAEAIGWISRLYPGVIEDEPRLLRLLKEELHYRAAYDDE